MRVSREQMAENRRRILDAASRLFRDEGVRRGQRRRSDEAAASPMAASMAISARRTTLWPRLLPMSSPWTQAEGAIFAPISRPIFRLMHRDNAADGCPTAGLAADIRHQTAAARLAMTEGLRSQIDRISEALPGVSAADRRRAAIGSWAAMVGAVILARAIDDPALSDEVLEQTRAWIDAAISQVSAS